MKISTKGRYGLRALVDLAVYTNGNHIALSSIAERQGISLNYLEQVFSSLKKSGIVSSIKGSQGGYRLSKDPKEITIAEILEILEGPLTIVDEDMPRASAYADSLQNCIRKNVWDKMNAALYELLKSQSLEHLAENYRSSVGIENTMYFI